MQQCLDWHLFPTRKTIKTRAWPKTHSVSSRNRRSTQGACFGGFWRDRSRHKSLGTSQFLLVLSSFSLQLGLLFKNQEFFRFTPDSTCEITARGDQQSTTNVRFKPIIVVIIVFSIFVVPIMPSTFWKAMATVQMLGRGGLLAKTWACCNCRETGNATFMAL